jgi:hypothetical protein
MGENAGNNIGIREVTGCFYGTGSGGCGASGGDGRNNTVNISATRSSSIYTNNIDYVQPASVTILFIIKY